MNKYLRTMRQFLENRFTLPKDIVMAKSYPYFPNQVCINVPRRLYEGLVNTYPTIKSVDYIKKELARKDIFVLEGYINDFNGKLGKEYDIADFVTFVFDGYDFNKGSYDEALKLFDSCGYYLSCFYWAEGKSRAIMQFEPKFQDGDSVNIGKYLFHVTTRSRANKILRQGFVPKAKNPKFNYPPRCYFFTEFDKDFFIEFMQNSLGNIDIEDIVVLVLDTAKIKNDVKLWKGKLFVGEDIAVYTYENVPSNAIIDVMKLVDK